MGKGAWRATSVVAPLVRLRSATVCPPRRSRVPIACPVLARVMGGAITLLGPAVFVVANCPANNGHHAGRHLLQIVLHADMPGGLFHHLFVRIRARDEIASG